MKMLSLHEEEKLSLSSALLVMAMMGGKQDERAVRKHRT